MSQADILKGVKSIHFIGVCGYIMSAMAIMLKQMGYRVSGSDQDAYPPATVVIDNSGIKRFKKHSPANLGNCDLVVVGNHIREDNPESRAAFKQKLRVVSLPELIGQVFAGKKKIVVAGTHGKTTTTSFIAWVLETAGLKPSYLIGGLMRNTGRGFKLNSGDFFVIEGDEYRTAFFDRRPKFLHYQPDIAVLTTCELDHPDYFKNLSEVEERFGQFLKLTPEDGLVVAGADDPRVERIAKAVKRPKIYYGLSSQADYQAFDLNLGETSSFKVREKGKFLGEFEILLPGVINVQNSLAAVGLADYLGVDREKIKKALASFKGANRRFEVLGQARGITVIDDYAHHPTKIRKTLAAARTRYQKNKIYCLFQPHTYSRTKALLADYARAFNQADEVIIAPLMPAREAGQKPTIDSAQVVKAIKAYHRNVKLLSGPREIIDYLVARLLPDDVVIVMSVGGMDGLGRRLLQSLKRPPPGRGQKLR
jgi:UDP-N-acetylmuramate: L-alanyl-gamma-D-glutamyl-meso-diaminopimelate ligase